MLGSNPNQTLFETTGSSPKSLSLRDRDRLFLPLPPGEGWGEGIKIIDEAFDLIPLILSFSLREKGLPDFLKWFCKALGM